MPLSNESIVKLRKHFSWPQNKPDFNEVEWQLDGGGKHLVCNQITVDKPFLIIEIGSFLGSSIKIWLNKSPNVYVISIDPWEDGWPEDYAKEHGRDNVGLQFSRKDGLYMTFLSSLWEYKNQIFPVRGKSPDKLYELSEMGIEPDLLYFDSDKVGDDIQIAHELFPNAIITGDDWSWGINEGYPIRKAVKTFIKNNNYKVVSYKATWIIKQSQLSFKEKYYNVVNLARDLVRKIKYMAKNK